MLFILEAEAVFEAKDVDHALSLLSAHFRKVAIDVDSKDDLFIQGEVSLTPCTLNLVQ